MSRAVDKLNFTLSEPAQNGEQDIQCQLKKRNLTARSLAVIKQSQLRVYPPPPSLFTFFLNIHISATMMTVHYLKKEKNPYTFL